MKKLIIVLVFILTFLSFAWREIGYRNEGVSMSTGTVGNGAIGNPYLIPYAGPNFRYFSPLSYFIMDNAYTHSSVHHTVLDAFKQCEASCPNAHFRIMECSDFSGGKMMMHNTHQNGTSIDFAIPKIRNGKQVLWLDKIGVWHYLFDFKDDGRLRIWPEVELDFESMARFILALDDQGRHHGVRVKKVILKIELKDEFYSTPSGKEVKRRGIYLARFLNEPVNSAHEDHIHIDFSVLN